MEQNKKNILIIGLCLSFLIAPQISLGQTTEEEPVKVTYRKDCEYIEPQYNLPGARQYIVIRDKTYADGKTITDITRSAKWITADGVDDAGWRNDVYELGVGDHLLNDGSLLRYGQRISDGDDSYGRQSSEYAQCFRIFYHSIGVPDLNKLEWQETDNNDNWGNMTNLKEYKIFNTDVYYNPDNPQPGWYEHWFTWAAFSISIKYNDSYQTFRRYRFSFQNIGTILYADNQLFDFYEYKPTYDVDFRVKDITMNNGTPAKVFTYECKRKFGVGPDECWVIVDSIYQLSPDEVKQWKPTPSSISYQVGNDMMVSERPFSECVIKEDEQNFIWKKYE